MTYAQTLDRLGAGVAVRAALDSLPDGFAEAFAAEAWRMIEAESVPVRPNVEDGDALPVLGWFDDEAKRILLMETGVSSDGVAPLPLMRWRIVNAIRRLDAGRLTAYCTAFRCYVVPAWEAAHGRTLRPDGADWPPLTAVLLPNDWERAKEKAHEEWTA